MGLHEAWPKGRRKGLIGEKKDVKITSARSTQKAQPEPSFKSCSLGNGPAPSQRLGL